MEENCMNKKLVVVSILAVFTLVAISFASAVNTNTTNDIKKKESPLYKIRTSRAIGENLLKIIEYLKTKFLGDRIFFLPFQWLKNRNGGSGNFYTQLVDCTFDNGPGCPTSLFCKN